MKIIKPSVTLEWITPDALSVIERAGRTCYKSEYKSDADPGTFVRRLIKRGHLSVIEHAVASLRIVCDRGVSHEIVRHRLASYSQESTRYCNYSSGRFEKKISVIIPDHLVLYEEAYERWHDSVSQSEEAYFDLLAAGITPEIARSVLPTCLATELVMTANFREWRHFFALRCATEAHPDMRHVAELARDVLRHECPVVFGE
ncbi:MAG TPA: FAD-dependent thymidylate synthase [Kiritimatiellia bacterium]|nr:FAD-dependent thymidylate synthase [Kiritimatiellia bacterium]